MQSNISDTRRRVKVYQLNEDRQWDDRGTGHVQVHMDASNDTCSLLVKSETDQSVLLDSEIRTDTNYSKQQETLIVWSEDNSDLALSFQERSGCEEIWERICQQQGRDPEADNTINTSEDEDDEVELPKPSLQALNDIKECFTQQNRMLRRERLSSALKNQQYIPQLLDVFQKAEDIEDETALKSLYEIFKAIWMLNQGEIYEILFNQKYIFDVVGVMEYDPSRKTNPVKHREFLRNKASFRDVLPITDTNLRDKINQTYRMQYVQESVLPAPSMFEQDNLSTLASFVFFSKVDIVKMILKDPETIGKCLVDLKNPQTPAKRQAELCGFLKEFFVYSTNLQQPEKESFLELLLQKGILNAIEILLQSGYSSIRALGSELICQIVDLNQQPSIVRDHIMKTTNMRDPARVDLMSLLLNVMLNDPDPELGTAIQLTNTIRTLLDPENMLRSSTEKAEFLGFFYRDGVIKLTNFLQNATTDTQIKNDDYRTAHTLVIVLELLMFMVEHHTYHIKNYILHRNALKRALLLIHSKHTSLSLSSLRLLRKIIGKTDESYNNVIVKRDLLAELVEALFKNGRRYNLLNSAILECFKYIKDENIKTLINYVMENYWNKLKLIKYTNLFDQMKEKYDANTAEQHRRESGTNGTPGMGWRFRNDPRQLEEDEREWFSDEEDKSETKKSLVDYENSDSEPETEKDQKATVTATEEVSTNENTSTNENASGGGDAAISEVDKSDNNSDATTPTLGEKREPIEDGNEENPKRLKITTEESEKTEAETESPAAPPLTDSTTPSAPPSTNEPTSNQPA